MSSEDHSKGYAKYLNKDLNTLTKCSTNEDVALLYDKWASTYDKVRMIRYHSKPIERDWLGEVKTLIGQG